MENPASQKQASTPANGSSNDSANPTVDKLRVAFKPMQFVAFWAAILLPLVYLPMLYGGLNGHQQATFVALLGANLLSFVVGHGHKKEKAL